MTVRPPTASRYQLLVKNALFLIGNVIISKLLATDRSRRAGSQENHGMRCCQVVLLAQIHTIVDTSTCHALASLKPSSSPGYVLLHYEGTTFSLLFLYSFSTKSSPTLNPPPPPPQAHAVLISKNIALVKLDQLPFQPLTPNSDTIVTITNNDPPPSITH